MSRVSVIIPSYNHEKYISRTIKSVLEQTYQDFEIIITDDGSSDNTIEEINKYSDPRIKLFVFNENQGACLAANNCIKNSKSEYIAMLSSDDVFITDKLEKQIRFLDDHRDYAAVFSYVQLINEEGNNYRDKKHPYYSIFEQPNRTRYEWLKYFFYKGNCLCHPSMVIHAKCYDDVGYYDPRFAQLPDLDFWIRLCLKHNIFILPESLLKLRIRSDGVNVSSVRPDSLKRHFLEFYIILTNYLKIMTGEDLIKIFPETIRFGTNQDNLIPYYLAKLALECDTPSHRLFAMDTLFRIFNDDQTIDDLNRKIGVKYLDLIKLSGETDIFNIKNNENPNKLYSALYNTRGWNFLRKWYKLKETIFPQNYP